MKIKPTDTLEFPPQKGHKDAATSGPKTRGNLALSIVASFPKEAERCPFRQLIREWLDYCRADGLSPRTLVDYRDKTFKFWWWWSDFTHLAETKGAHPENVGVRDARAFAAYLKEPQAFRWGVTDFSNNQHKETLAAASVSSYGRTVKAFFNWLEREQYIEKSPFNKSVRFTNRHQADRSTIRRVERADLDRIFAVLTDPKESQSEFLLARNLAIFSLLLDTGIRRGELLSIRLGDIDLLQARVTVTGKTGRRVVPLSKPCRDVLYRYLQQPMLAHKLARFEDEMGVGVAVGQGHGQSQSQGQGQASLEPVWITSDGRPLSDGGFAAVIRSVKRKSGINFHAHKLRHTFASMMAGQVGVFDLKELMGHSSITTTQIYVHEDFHRLQELHRTTSPLNSLEVSRELRRKRGRPAKPTGE